MDRQFQLFGFTYRYPSQVREIITDAWLSKDSLSDSPIESDFAFLKVRAIWDTGATNTAITPSLFEKLDLVSEDQEEVHTAGGITMADICYVAIGLPNQLVIPRLRVTVCDEMVGEGQMLIGMDVIGQGDFSFTFGKYHPALCYLAPSSLHIDYGRDPMVYGYVQNAEQVPQVGRNEPCPCNSGHKYKYCHGIFQTPPSSAPFIRLDEFPLIES